MLDRLRANPGQAAKAYASVLVIAALEYVSLFYVRPGERGVEYALFAFAVAYLMWRFVFRRPLGELGLNENAKAGRQALAYGAAWGALIAVAIMLLGARTGALEVRVDQYGVIELMRRFTLVKLMVASAVIAAGVEFAYRGFLNSALATVHSRMTAYIVSSAVYGLGGVIRIEFGPSLFLNLFLLGLVLSLLRERRGDLMAPIGAQTVWLWAFIIGRPVFSGRNADFAVTGWTALPVLAAAAAWLLYRNRARLWPSTAAAPADAQRDAAP